MAFVETTAELREGIITSRSDMWDDASEFSQTLVEVVVKMHYEERDRSAAITTKLALAIC